MSSSITFLQYTPNQEKKRNLSGAACVNCRKAHAACNSYRPCDRCIRMKCECVETVVSKKKKVQGDSSGDDINNYLDVDTVSELLFSDTTPKQMSDSLDSASIFPPPATPDLVVPSPNSLLSTPPHTSPPTSFSHPTSFSPPTAFSPPASFSPPQAQLSPNTMLLTPQQIPVSPVTLQNQFPQNQLISQNSQNFPQNQIIPQNQTTSQNQVISQTHTVPQTQDIPETITFQPLLSLDFPPSEAEQFTKPHFGNDPIGSFNVSILPENNDQVSVSGVNSANVVAKVEELAAQNKRMEQTVNSLAQKVEQLESQIQKPSRVYVTPNSSFTPATASWKLPYCELLEYNQAFLDIMGYRVDDKSPPVTFFELGACKDKIALIKKKIDYSIEHNEPLTDPTFSHTIVVPMIKKSKEVIQMNLSVVIMLSAPQPVMTTIMHPLN